MSRSYKKKPFLAITGGSSAKDDKKHAHRGERSAQRLAIRLELKDGNFENFILPHRYECSWNEVYCWVRDGNQMYKRLGPRDWALYVEASRPLTEDEKIEEVLRTLEGKVNYFNWYRKDFSTWPPLWYKKMMRK